ncbi:MAG: histidinol-phosphate transaminase [Caldilineaceae bacterium]|nr:histidinol-phosphate transaminase [Caldilineaceae bacterium]
MNTDHARWFKSGIRSLAPIERGLVDDTLHRLQWNENPIDFPADLKEEVMQRMAQLEWSRYPRGSRPWQLIGRLAQHTGVPAEQIVVSEGSADLIKLIMAATLQPGATVVMPAPTFLLYRLNARMQEANRIEIPLVPENGYALPVAALSEAAQQHQAPLVVVCAPNNPTGTVYDLADLRQLAIGCPGLLVIDAAYAEFCHQDLTPLLDLDNVVIVRTFSKVYAMAGVRVGYALTSAAIARELQKVVTVFPLSVFSEVTATVALENYDRFMAARDVLVKERERLAAALRGVPGVRVFSSGTNFLLVQLDYPKQALLSHLVKQHHVLISDMAAYPELDNCVRISLGTPAQNDLVIQGFRELSAQQTL